MFWKKVEYDLNSQNKIDYLGDSNEDAPQTDMDSNYSLQEEDEYDFEQENKVKANTGIINKNEYSNKNEPLIKMFFIQTINWFLLYPGMFSSSSSAIDMKSFVSTNGIELLSCSSISTLLHSEISELFRFLLFFPRTLSRLSK